MFPTQPADPWRYLVTPATLSVACLIKLTIPGLSFDAPYLLWSIVIAVAAIWNGIIVAVLVAAVCELLVIAFFLPAGVTVPEAIAQAIVLLGTALVIGGLARYATLQANRASEAAQRFEKIAETTSNGIIECNEHRRITYANASVRRMLGYNGSLVGRLVDELVPPDFSDGHRSGFTRYLESGRRELDWDDIHVPAKRSSGDIVDLDLTMREYWVDGEHRFAATILRARTRL